MQIRCSNFSKRRVWLRAFSLCGCGRVALDRSAESLLCCVRASIIVMPFVADVFKMVFISWYAGQMSFSPSLDELR